MKLDVKKLEGLLSYLEKEKSRTIELETEKKLILKQLKEDFDCSSEEEAQELLEQMEEELEELEKEIDREKKSLITEMSKYGYL